MKKKCLKIFSLIICLLCAVSLCSCKQENTTPTTLVSKNEIISTALDKISTTLDNSQQSIGAINVANPTFDPSCVFNAINPESSHIDLAPNMMMFIKNVINSNKVELYGIDSQVISALIVRGTPDTIMKFRVVVDENNNKFTFEVASSGALHYNAYICLDAIYDYDNNQLSSYTIAIEGDLDMVEPYYIQEFIKYDGTNLQQMDDISSISSQISLNYTQFKNMQPTVDVIDLTQEYGNE